LAKNEVVKLHFLVLRPKKGKLVITINFSIMDKVLEILKYILPSLVVMTTAWVMVRYYFKSFMREQNRELLLQDRKKVLPLRLQAYERMTLFLERITVDSLLVREQESGLTNREFHQRLLILVRAEFEHNLAQQIYISSEAWSMIRGALDATLVLINKAALEVNPESNAVELSKKILELQAEQEYSAAQEALSFLKKEIKSVLNF
jgi:hypothetical protein